MHTNAQASNGPLPFAVDSDERHQLASYHAALFPTRLALSRWQHGGHIPHLHQGAESSTTNALRVAWYAAARRDFQAWLDRGGFSQYEEAPLSSCPVQFPHCQPVPDGDTEQVGTCT